MDHLGIKRSGRLLLTFAGISDEKLIIVLRSKFVRNFIGKTPESSPNGVDPRQLSIPHMLAISSCLSFNL